MDTFNPIEESPKKIGIFRYVIERMFCHHAMEETFRVEVKDGMGYVVGINATLVCKNCGKTKDIRI